MNSNYLLHVADKTALSIWYAFSEGPSCKTLGTFDKEMHAISLSIWWMLTAWIKHEKGCELVSIK